MTAAAAPPNGTRLNQVIAVRATVKSDAHDSLTKKYRLLAQKPLLAGLARSYKPREDEGFVYPGESSLVQVKAEEVLKDIAAEMTKLFDVNATIDWTNQQARADIVLLGGDQPVTLLEAVPVSYLMFLEKQLNNLETVIRNLPVLDPGEQWTHDPATDVYASAPVQTTKSKKVPRNHVLAPATERHPAQVQVWHEDIPEGTWTTVKSSGALPAARVNKMLGRVTALAAAVKFAREQANLVEVIDVKPGRRVFDYLFAADA